MAKAKSTAVATTVHKAVALPTDVNEMFKTELASIKTRIHQPTGQWIKVEGKEFVLPDGRRNTTLDACIVDFICANNNYDTDFVEGEQNSPSCFALGFDVDDLSPSASIKEPVNETCLACPNKAWGSHRNGRGGKACDDNRNYVIMETLADGTAKLYMLKASKTAVKAFDAYVNEIASVHNRPLRGVMTRIGFDPNSKYPSQRWECLGAADNATIMLAQSNLDEAKRMLQVEPSITAANDEDGGKAEAAKPATKAKRAARK